MATITIDPHIIFVIWRKKPIFGVDNTDYGSVMKKFLALFAAVLVSVSLMGQDDKVFRVGIDASADCFDASLDKISYGLGVRSRLGRHDQWLNLVGGVRYIYGTRLSGIQVPVLLNVNLLKCRPLSAYVGAGYEFDFIGTYWGCMKFQTGLAARHFDLRVFYKPYQGDVGAGLTYFF